MAARIKKLAGTGLDAVMREQLVHQNRCTLNAVIKQGGQGDEGSQSIVDSLTWLVASAPASFAKFKRAETWFDERHSIVRNVAHSDSREERKSMMQDPKLGIKHMAAAIGKQAAKPLMHAKRTKTGPMGQAIGSITTQPSEVDDIAREAWQNIYEGNSSDIAATVSAFLGKYAKYILYAKPFQVQPITAEEVQAVCAFLLRCYRITLLPLLIYSVLLWGFGLAGGYFLAYVGTSSMPASQLPVSFWSAATLALAAVACCFLALLWRATRQTSK